MGNASVGDLKALGKFKCFQFCEVFKVGNASVGEFVAARKIKVSQARAVF